MGGLSKRKTLFKKLNVNTEEALLIDAGALLFNKSSYSSQLDLDLAKINAEGLIEAYNDLGYEAVGISEIDLAGGINFLKLLAEKSKFPWISANIVDSKNNHCLFVPYIIKNKNGIRIAITGLAGTGAADDTNKNVGYKTLGWSEVLPRLLKEISSQTDLCILLSSLSPRENEQISKQLPSINIIIQAGRYSLNRTPLLINNTLICQTEKQGKYIGQLRIKWGKNGRWAEQTSQSSQNPPADQISLTEGSSTYENDFLALDSSIVNDPIMEKIVAQTKTKVNAFGRSNSSYGELGDYVGSDACFECHSKISRKWQKTGHARAYTTLVEKKQEFNLTCLPCHVTGVSLSESNRSFLLSLPARLYNVGCETCHGAGKAHTIAPEKTKMNASPGAFICLQCHTSEHDGAFHFEQDKKLLH